MESINKKTRYGFQGTSSNHQKYTIAVISKVCGIQREKVSMYPLPFSDTWNILLTGRSRLQLISIDTKGVNFFKTVILLLPQLPFFFDLYSCTPYIYDTVPRPFSKFSLETASSVDDISGLCRICKTMGISSRYNWPLMYRVWVCLVVNRVIK